MLCEIMKDRRKQRRCCWGSSFWRSWPELVPVLASEAQLTPIAGVSESSLRWWDVASNVYDSAYSDTYIYDDATVILTYGVGGDPATLAGHLSAVNLKPNFAYQMKLEGKPTGLWGVDGDDDANEVIGFLGRWWRDQPSPGSQLPTRTTLPTTTIRPTSTSGICFSIFSSPTAPANAEVDFALDSSLHVLATDSQGSPGVCDTPFQWRTVVGSAR